MLKKKILWIFLGGMVLSVFMITPVLAGENVLGLDDSNTYDIYMADYTGSFTVIKNVDIVGVKDLFGKKFLAIQTESFNPKASEGLIMLDYIRAILPAHKILAIQGNRIFSH